MKRLAMVAVAAAVVAAWAAAATAADEKTTAAAKAILKDHAGCMVTVEAVVKMQTEGMGVQFGHGNEQKAHANGVVVDPGGLTVCPLSRIDQASMLSSLNIMGQEIKMKTDISDVKIRLADGTELPAKIVLKDTDLDLAFVMPDKDEKVKTAKFTALDLSKSGKAGVLDNIIVLSRLGKNLDNQPAVFVGEIAAVVTKPRTFYVAMAPLFGSPVFTADGKVLGITVMRKAVGGRDAFDTMGFMPVILPAGDVQEIAKQAMTQKPAEAKDKGDKPAGAAKDKDL